MDSRAPATSLCLYKETRLSLEPPPTSTVVQLQLPTANTFGRATRVSRKVITNTPACHNEEEFRKRHVASASSIYFRGLSRYPRAILWRCLESNSVLELRSVDYSKNEKEPREASFIARFVFPHVIRTGGVALSDPVDEDLLNVFVITKGNDLYTFTLRPSFFCQPAASEDDLERWYKIFKPSSLAISNSYKLIAPSSRELLISLGDGRLARLTRKKGEDGSQWTESTYNGGQWGSSLRGLIRWQANNSVRFEGNSLDRNTVVAASTSPDLEHIFVVCLNHTLRVWNIDTGKQTISRDLLDIPREPQDAPKVMLNPSIATPLQIFNSHSSGGYKYFAVTYSPLSSGVFKFWGIRDADSEEGGLRDLFPDDSIRLPDSDDEALWALSDFSLKASPDTAQVEIWILLRLNKRYKLYHRKFPELQNIGEDWEFGWEGVAIDSVRREPLNQPPTAFSAYDCEDINSKWLEFLLAPLRIPHAVLDAALTTYAQTRDIPIPKSSKLTLKDKLSSVIASRVHLHQSGKQNSTYDSIEKLHRAVFAEWNNYWNIVSDIDQSRWEPMSLSLDRYSDIPWIVLTDGLSAVRTCSEIEILSDNKPKDLLNNPRPVMLSVEGDGEPVIKRQSDEMSKLIEAAGKFRSGFSEQLKAACEDELLEEMWTSPSHSVPTRIQLFYDHCNFSNEINDRQYNELASSLQELGGFDGLTTESFIAVVDSIAPNPKIKSPPQASTSFGQVLLLRGAQDMIAVHSRVLSDLLFLTVFVDVDVDRDEHQMVEFDSVPIYIALLKRLRQARLCQWLATSIRPDPKFARKESIENTTGASNKDAPVVFSTVLENLFAREIQFNSDAESQCPALTYYIRDVLTFAAAEAETEITLDNVLVAIQCNLLQNNNISLASSFQMYQPDTAWATYVRGRLCLLRQEYNEAAIYFGKAAFKLSRSAPSAEQYVQKSFSLIDPVTASLLASGLPNYYTHITNLFAPLRIHNQAVYFAQLALQHCSPCSSPAQHNDLLARVFHASLALADFSAAYSALIRYTDRALQRSALSSLVSTMASQDAVDELLRFPFPTLQKEVDAWLVERVRVEAQTQQRGDFTPFFKILYAWRLRQGDYRGAAAVLIERLELKKKRRNGGRYGGQKEAEKALDEYLVGINALALVGDEEDGWVFVDGEDGKRKVVRLIDLREEYEKEMDRVGMMELGRFGIFPDEDEDEDVEMND